MNRIIKQLPTFVNRTYMGGSSIRKMHGMDELSDNFYPEDWITSFTEAKNRQYIQNEGITRVETENGIKFITDVVHMNDFGEGRTDPGVLIKFLDSAERLCIQVHPTREYARKVFNVNYGKTESWYILETRCINGEKACIYIGFKEGVTREKWKELYDTQDITGMLDAMHRFEVKQGDVVLVTGGTPHAIGGGCFLLEVQEPTDYTMRAEKVTLAGERLTPFQIHYNKGDEALLNCFEYSPLTREAARKKYFIHNSAATKDIDELVTYKDTPCFAYKRIHADEYRFEYDSYVTLIALSDGGTIETLNEADKEIVNVRRGDKYFIPAGSEICMKQTDMLISFPPKLNDSCV